ncbi:cysteine proteinase, partial [Caulochytrium protostelioides]
GEPPRGGNGQTAVPSAVFAALTNSAQRLGPGEGGAVNGTAARHFLSFRQQDAHELLTLLAAVGLEETRRLVPRAWGPFEAATAFAAVGAGRAPRLGLPVVTAAARESRLDADACRVACAIPLTGLLGTRIHCRVCRYTTPLRLETFTSLSLAIPPAGRDDRTRVEDLLAHYMRPEAIEGYACDRCRLRAWCRVADETLVEAERLVALAAAPSPLPASGKRGGKHGAAGASRKQPAKPRTAKAQQASLAVPHLAVVAEQARLLKQALASHHYSFASEGQSKITLIPRPPVAPDAVVQRTTVVVRWPPTLCIHIQRSAISPYGDVYKDRRPVIFRETLGVDAGVGGSIEGGWGPGGPGDMPAPGPASLPELHARLAERPGGQAVEYGLRAVVLHFGGHDSGHYTALRQVCVPDAAPPAEPSGAAKRRRWCMQVCSSTTADRHDGPRPRVR